MSADVTDSMTAEACWRLLERVAACSTLKRAARLREFLYFVGTKSLKEGRSDLHEQEIGHVVFGRDSNYDTGQDNIVRVSATELRKRIETYFAGEGKDEPLIFEIPRGSYVPQFRVRPVVLAASAAAPVQELLQPASRHRWTPLIPAVVAVALAIVCALLWRQNTLLQRQAHAWKSQQALAAFWAPFFASDRNTDVVLGDPLLQIVQEKMGRQYSLASFLDRSDIRDLQSCSGCGDTQALLALESELAGSFAEFRAAQRAIALESRAGMVALVPARAYSSERMQRDNVILIGSRQSNPWVEVFAGQLNFVLAADRGLNRTVVRNLHPQAGEQPQYAAAADAQGGTGYSVIAFLPSPGGASHALILAATSEQTLAAATGFLVSETSMEALLRLLPARKMRPFELVLRTSSVANAPPRAEIVAWRLH